MADVVIMKLQVKKNIRGTSADRTHEYVFILLPNKCETNQSIPVLPSHQWHDFAIDSSMKKRWKIFRSAKKLPVDMYHFCRGEPVKVSGGGMGIGADIF